MKYFITEFLQWILVLLKILLALLLLALAKVTLRTNPDLALSVLGTAAVMFIIWYFLPQIKHFFQDK